MSVRSEVRTRRTVRPSTAKKMQTKAELQLVHEDAAADCFHEVLHEVNIVHGKQSRCHWFVCTHLQKSIHKITLRAMPCHSSGRRVCVLLDGAGKPLNVSGMWNSCTVGRSARRSKKRVQPGKAGCSSCIHHLSAVSFCTRTESSVPSAESSCQFREEKRSSGLRPLQLGTFDQTWNRSCQSQRHPLRSQ